ncbi:hypothetical protein [Rhodoblastus sp.]|uniref:hypothetical protein n=1 Tax=Rhodoblastus sp. TaxID=1962975 RepID=UPI003F946B92
MTSFPSLGGVRLRDALGWRRLGFPLQGRRFGACFRTDEHSRTRLARTILVLIPAAFILTGCAQSLETGRAGGGEESGLIAAYRENRTYLDAGIDETARDGRPETEENEFETVMTSACGAGDVFGCGLLFAWRALLALLHLFERLVTYGLIALGFPFLIWASLREAKMKRSRKAKKIARDSLIGPRLPMAGSGECISAMPEEATRQARRLDRRLP